MAVAAEHGPRMEREIEPAARAVQEHIGGEALGGEPLADQLAFPFLVQPEIAAARAHDHGGLRLPFRQIGRQGGTGMHGRAFPDLHGLGLQGRAEHEEKKGQDSSHLPQI